MQGFDDYFGKEKKTVKSKNGRISVEESKESVGKSS
jgi:hypothetical protein